MGVYVEGIKEWNSGPPGRVVLSGWIHKWIYVWAASPIRGQGVLYNVGEVIMSFVGC